jgi:hypothetical protein
MTPLTLLDRSRVRPFVAIPIAYVVVAVASSFVIRLKEPRYLLAIVPMLAITVALLVDWDRVWLRIRSPQASLRG